MKRRVSGIGMSDGGAQRTGFVPCTPGTPAKPSHSVARTADLCFPLGRWLSAPADNAANRQRSLRRMRISYRSCENLAATATRFDIPVHAKKASTRRVMCAIPPTTHSVPVGRCWNDSDVRPSHPTVTKRHPLMPSRNRSLAAALRTTAANLRSGARYEWGHMGRCNCGHLMQTLTGLTDREIVARVGYELDEWTEHARGRCETTGAAADDIFQTLAKAGLTRADIAHLEHLSDPHVLRLLGNRTLRKNSPTDAAAYMEAMATIAEVDGQCSLATAVVTTREHRPPVRSAGLHHRRAGAGDHHMHRLKTTA